MKKHISRFVVLPLAIVAAPLAAAYSRLRMVAFGHRFRVVQAYAGTAPRVRAPRVAVAIVHAGGDNRRAESLRATIDGLVESLAHAELELVVVTPPGGGCADRLPDGHRALVAVAEQEALEDPWHLGFRALDELFARLPGHDWYVYVEDDIVLRDSAMLEKLAAFNAMAGDAAVLLPHRYELDGGRKTYIDARTQDGADEAAWSRLGVVEDRGLRFAEFENPHSGFHCLSAAQMAVLQSGGRRWRERVSFVDPLTSAAAGSLAERFRIYKSHPANMHWFEVRHCGVKYTRIIDEAVARKRAVPA